MTARSVDLLRQLKTGDSRCREPHLRPAERRIIATGVTEQVTTRDLGRGTHSHSMHGPHPAGLPVGYVVGGRIRDSVNQRRVSGGKSRMAATA